MPGAAARGRGHKVKNYRPHMLVAAMLAIALLTNWPAALRNVLVDLRFAWQSRAAARSGRQPSVGPRVG